MALGGPWLLILYFSNSWYMNLKCTITDISYFVLDTSDEASFVVNFCWFGCCLMMINGDSIYSSWWRWWEVINFIRWLAGRARSKRLMSDSLTGKEAALLCHDILWVAHTEIIWLGADSFSLFQSYCDERMRLNTGSISTCRKAGLFLLRNYAID
jgi:hypothetical protein